jgi:bacterioferritin-associated ferredoxin
MFVCHCRVVSSVTIEREIAAGASTVAEIGARCEAGTKCGRCQPVIEVLLHEHAVRAAAGQRDGGP